MNIMSRYQTKKPNSCTVDKLRSVSVSVLFTTK